MLIFHPDVRLQSCFLFAYATIGSRYTIYLHFLPLCPAAYEIPPEESDKSYKQHKSPMSGILMDYCQSNAGVKEKVTLRATYACADRWAGRHEVDAVTMWDIYKGTTVSLFTWGPMTGGILTGERGNQSLYQSLSFNSGSDSWCDTYCCPCMMGGPLSASIRGDTHQLNLHTPKHPAV